MIKSRRYFLDIYQKATIRLIYKLEKSFFRDFDFKGKKILDMGCWWGWFIKYARNKNAIVYGFDIARNKINDAITFIGADGLCMADALAMPFKNHYFDMLFSWHLLEHVEKPDMMLSEIFRVLNKEGVLVLGVPNDYNLSTLPYRWLRLVLNKECTFLKRHSCYNFLRSLAYSDFTHKREYTKKKICEELEDNNFKIDYVESYGVELSWPLPKMFSRQQRAFIQYKFGPLIPPYFRSGFLVKAYKK